MSRHVTFFQIVTQNGAHPQGLDGFEIGNNLGSAFERVLGFQFDGDRGAVDQCVIEDSLHLSVMVEGADMIGRAQSQALISLSHQVAYVNLHCGRIDDRVRNPVHQQIGNKACE